MSSIDVVVTCYNYGRFLRESVASVLAQSHPDLRVVIVDDASSDETPEVAAAIAAADPRVELRRHATNIGHIRTFNEAIDLARADYLLILSADDFILPGALARAAAVFDRRADVGLVYGEHVLYEAGRPLPAQGEGEPTVIFPTAARLVESLATRNSVGTATAIVRTRVQKAIGGFRPELPHSGDLEMWVRFALASQVAYIDAPQAVYRRHEANMSLGYDGVADIRQCIAAYALHYDAIRRLAPDGPKVEAEIHRRFAVRAGRVARTALRSGRIDAALAMGRLSLAEWSAAWGLARPPSSVARAGRLGSIDPSVRLGHDVVIPQPELVNLYGCAIGAGTRIGAFVEIQKGAVVGERCKISSHSFVCEGVVIEDEVFVGHGVAFTNDRYPRAVNADGSVKGDADWRVVGTRVCRGASIGSHASILPGLTIGENAMVAAGSVVTASVPPGTIVAGVPARVVGKVDGHPA